MSNRPARARQLHAAEINRRLAKVERWKGIGPAVVSATGPLTIRMDGTATDVTPTYNVGSGITTGDTGIYLWQPPVLVFIKTN